MTAISDVDVLSHSQLDEAEALQHAPEARRRAKIVCTLGPSSNSESVIRDLMHAGMDVVRLNFSHGTHEEHGRMIERIRKVAARMGRSVCILQDLQGPKIRTGRLKYRTPVALKAGSRVTITPRDIPGTSQVISTTFPTLAQEVQAGDRILLADGLIELRVKAVKGDDVECEVINGGLLGEHKGINLPGAIVNTPSLTEKDEKDLKFGLKHGVDAIAMSFVRTADDVRTAKRLIAADNSDVPLIAKLEKPQAIEHLEEILDVADGVMVARGDLGVETSVELVPVYQKRIIELANDAGKLVITATQMLQSMVDHPRPTRAEATDVANAVWDGSDCVMLSGETATGQYPVAAVATMARIIETAETRDHERPSMMSKIIGRQTGRVSRALCEAAAFAADEMSTRTIAVFTESGLMARRLSALRPRQLIVAMTSSRAAINELSLIWGVDPVQTPQSKSVEELLKMGEKTLLDAGLVAQREMIVIMAGRLSGLGLSSSVSLYQIGGELEESIHVSTVSDRAKPKK